MQFRGGMNELMRQAARMQRRVEEAKAELGKRELRHSSAGDQVSVTITLSKSIARIEVADAFYKNEDKDLVLDSISAAINNAITQADKEMDAELAKITGGVKIPGIT
jgi:nucleoid-associated protein EbfC